MPYKYYGDEIGDYSYIARGTNVSDAISFKLADFKGADGVSYFQGDTYTGRYIKCNSGILSGKWGSAPFYEMFKYLDGGTIKSVPFAFANRCPSFRQWYSDPESWGNLNIEGPTTIYLSCKNESKSNASMDGIYYSTDGSSWNRQCTPLCVCFVDLVAGGGGGGGGLIYRSDVQEVHGGGGGGGGAFVRVALDLEKTGKVTITIGGGGSEGVSLDSSNHQGGSGGQSSIVTSSGITITCHGGGGGAGGSAGNGGQITNSLGDVSSKDASKGLLDIQPYYGKPGGAGGFISGSIKPAGSAGTAFAASDVFSSFGILAIDKAVVESGYRGYGGSPYANSSYSNYEYAVQGGGAGASAIGGGYHSSYSGSHHGFGGGGNGASLGYTFKNWGSDEYNYDTKGCSGGKGACIVHYFTGVIS